MRSSAGWHITRPGGRDQCTDRAALDRSRVPVRILNREIRGAVDALLRHAKRFQTSRAAEPGRKIDKGRRAVASANCACDRRIGLRCGGGVVAHRVRQDHGMRVGMRKIERAADDMAQLVM